MWGIAMSHIKNNREGHPPLEDILDYIGNRMLEEDVFAFESHLGTCDECIDRVRAHALLKTEIEEFLDTPYAVAIPLELPGRESVMVKISEKLGEIANRVREMLSSLPDSAETALRILIDASMKRARIISEGLQPVRRVDSSLRFDRASAFMAEPAVLGDMSEGEGASCSVVQSRGYPKTEIQADALEKTVIVHVTVREEDVSERRQPLAVLIPEEGGDVRVTALQPLEETRFRDTVSLLARFENVDGPFILLLEAGEPFA